MRLNVLTVYSKFCVSCVYKEDWDKVQLFASKHGYRLDTERTTYHPKRHAKATQLWGGEDYKAFMVTPSGEPISIVKLAKALTENGEWNNDVCDVQRTKDCFGEVAKVENGKKGKQRPKKSHKKDQAREYKAGEYEVGEMTSEELEEQKTADNRKGMFND